MTRRVMTRAPRHCVPRVETSRIPREQGLTLSRRGLYLEEVGHSAPRGKDRKMSATEAHQLWIETVAALGWDHPASGVAYRLMKKLQK